MCVDEVFTNNNLINYLGLRCSKRNPAAFGNYYSEIQSMIIKII